MAKRHDGISDAEGIAQVILLTAAVADELTSDAEPVRHPESGLTAVESAQDLFGTKREGLELLALLAKGVHMILNKAADRSKQTAALKIAQN